MPLVPMAKGQVTKWSLASMIVICILATSAFIEMKEKVASQPIEHREFVMPEMEKDQLPKLTTLVKDLYWRINEQDTK